MRQTKTKSNDAGNEASDLVNYDILHDHWLLTRWNIRQLLEHRRKYPNDPDGNFPLPVRIGRQNFWRLSELRAWAGRVRGRFFHPSHPKWLELRGQ